MNIAQVDYDGLIPNNVALGQDVRVKRALEKWHPGYLNWWNDMGPEGFQDLLVYLRTAVSVDPKGWAKFDYVRMPEYRWGVLLAPADGRPQGQLRHAQGRGCLAGSAGRISRDAAPPGGDPGRHRAGLGRAAALPGQDRALALRHAQPVPGQCGGRPPPLGDGLSCCKNISARDGREEAEALLQRRSGDPDTPRMLGAFNETTPDWLSFFMFTYFTDRDGKMQLEALAQSGFDPLSRTCRFMLTEEAHHMFVGETGVTRVIQRTCEAMKRSRHHRSQRDREGAQARRDRPADHPEESEPALLADARSVRQRNLDQRGECVPRGPQGPLSRGPSEGRSSARKRHLSGAAAGRRQDPERGSRRRCRRSTCGCATTTWSTAMPASAAGTR